MSRKANAVGLASIALTVTGLLVWLPSQTTGMHVLDPATQTGLLDSPVNAVASAAAGPAPSPATGATATSATAAGTSRSVADPAAALSAPDPRWVRLMAARTGIGARALTAYAAADLRMANTNRSCHLSWATLAGLGWVESQHGTIGGRTLGPDGRPGITPIIGVELSGAGPVATIADSDGGRLDGDTRYDRAVGPMQFLPSTWRTWGSDGDGDGVIDPQDFDDAAWSAARYLCAGGGALDQPVAWTRAVLSYNESDVYVADVVAATNSYASRART